MADGDVAELPRAPVLRDPITGRLLPGSGQIYTPEIGRRVCDALAVTPRGLKWICENLPGMPNYLTVLTWQRERQEFAKLLDEGHKRQADLLVGECMQIADDDSHDRLTVYAKGVPREVADLAGIARSNIRINTRMRVAKMLNPQKYGDKLDVTGRFGGYVSQDEAIDDLDQPQGQPLALMADRSGT